MYTFHRIFNCYVFFEGSHFPVISKIIRHYAKGGNCALLLPYSSAKLFCCGLFFVRVLFTSNLIKVVLVTKLIAIKILQVLLVYLTCVHCQQFTFDNNALPVPPRFLVPGAFSPPINSGSPQIRTRVLQPAAREDETIQRLRLPTGRTRAGTLPPANLVPFEPEHSPVSNKPPRIQSPQPVESLTIPTRPAVEEDEEDDTENSNTVASPVSTYEPNLINTVVARTQRPVAQFRPTKPQYFGNTNIIDEEERGAANINSEFHVTKAQKFDVSILYA